MDPCGLKHRPTERHGHEGGGHVVSAVFKAETLL